MRTAYLALSLTVAALACGCAPSASVNSSRPVTTGVLTGGLAPCERIPVPNGPTYAAGTAMVLRGEVTPGAQSTIDPADVVASADVLVDGKYRFVLDAGTYTVSGRQTGYAASVVATVIAGRTSHVDVPNVCK